MGEILSTVTVRVTRDGVVLKEAFVGLGGEKIVSDVNGVASFTNVKQGIYPITVQYEGKLFSVEAVVASPQIDISLTGREAIKSIPPARQEAYRVANQTAPQFIGFLVVVGLILVCVFFWLDVKLKKAKGYVKALVRVAAFVGISVLAVFAFSAWNGTSDKLFAMLIPQNSARAGEDAVPVPMGVSIKREGASAIAQWQAPVTTTAPITGYELALFEEGQDAPVEILFTQGTTITITLPQPSRSYRIQVRSVSGVIDPKLSIGITGAVPTP